MNNTKWNELLQLMYGLGNLAPRWRSKDLTGHVSSWDGEWFSRFSECAYDSIEWVEIQTQSPEQDLAVHDLLRMIRLPGHRIDSGYRVYGYAPIGMFVDYI